MEHNGHLQAGGVESGEPWAVAKAIVSERKIEFQVNDRTVGTYERDRIMVSPEGEVFRVVAPNETLFFRPASTERFALDLKEDRTAAEEITLASSAPADLPSSGERSKVAAGVLAILLGAFGVHKFYLGQTAMGLLYLIFFWTGIPALIGLIEGIVYLLMSDGEFARRYG